MGNVTVYSFMTYDVVSELSIQSSRMATLDAIAMMDGTPVEGSGVEIDGQRCLGGVTEADFNPCDRSTWAPRGGSGHSEYDQFVVH
jgi:hypothetical protein